MCTGLESLRGSAQRQAPSHFLQRARSHSPPPPPVSAMAYSSSLLLDSQQPLNLGTRTGGNKGTIGSEAQGDGGSERLWSVRRAIAHLLFRLPVCVPASCPVLCLISSQAMMTPTSVC
jgi:hypothetical protein